MFEELNGPSIMGVLTVTDTTPSEVKVGSNAYEERKVITLQSHKVDDPDFGDFYVYFADANETPVANDISTKGIVQNRNSPFSWEASPTQVVWIMAVTVASIKVRLAERA